MSKKIAVILSGCGVFDGAEIHESTLTLLFLDQQGATVQCFAPNITQQHVINHCTKQAMEPTRNVLEESARIARGNILDLKELNADDYDGVIIPGGMGSANNLSDFASKGSDCQVQPDVLSITQAFASKKKPIGLICISPHLAPKIYGSGVICTIGNDKNTAATLEKMGAIHQNCTVDDIVVDMKHNLITTPAYMLGKSIKEIAPGINKLVVQILKLADNT